MDPGGRGALVAELVATAAVLSRIRADPRGSQKAMTCTHALQRTAENADLFPDTDEVTGSSPVSPTGSWSLGSAPDSTVGIVSCRYVCDVTRVLACPRTSATCPSGRSLRNTAARPSWHTTVETTCTWLSHAAPPPSAPPRCRRAAGLTRCASSTSALGFAVGPAGRGSDRAPAGCAAPSRPLATLASPVAHGVVDTWRLSRPGPPWWTRPSRPSRPTGSRRSRLRPGRG